MKSGFIFIAASMILIHVNSFLSKFQLSVNRKVNILSLYTYYNDGVTNEINTDTSLRNFTQEVRIFLIKNNIPVQYKNNILAIGQPLQHDMIQNNDTQKFVLGIHLIPTPHSYETCPLPRTSKMITDNLDQTPFNNIIHLHEDIWENKKDIVMARILAKLSIVKSKWYARDTIAKRISVTEAIEFLEKHHLWGSTRAKFNYGLFLKDKEVIGKEMREDCLVAVATFSPRRHVQRHHSHRMYRSHELIRYCAKKDEVVLGGITKLLAQFCRDLAPDDILTCIDRDFGDGVGWEKIGFEKVQVMPPLVMAVGKNKEGDNLSLDRFYLVGAGIGSSSFESDIELKYKRGRRGINSTIYYDLHNAHNYLQAVNILMKYSLYPVYDAGVERRMVIVDRSKLKSHVMRKREELQLQNIRIPDNKTVFEIWRDSCPVFPDQYYSPNSGIGFLLHNANKNQL